MAQLAHNYILKWSKIIAHNVQHLALARNDNLPVPFIPGQFITLHIEGATKTLHRSYSIANIPNKNNIIEIVCKKVEGGVASHLLFNMQPGESILASGPHGLFVLKTDEIPARYIFIATGTGVTPYRSMLGEIKHRLETFHPKLEAVLILGVRNANELLFKDEFLKFSNEYKNFKFYACYSRDNEINQSSFERLGYVQDVLEGLHLNSDKDIIYLCGNPNMIDDVFTLLNSKGFDRKKIRKEKYLFSYRP